MAEEIDEGVVMRLVKGVLSHGVDGLGPMSSSKELADEYLRDSSYSSLENRVDAMIRWEASKNFGTGFVTGMGGLITLPVSIPASMYANWFVQARLAGGVASLFGYSTSEERVRTFILLSLIGDAGREVVKNAGVQIGNKVGMKALGAIPGKVLIEINKKVGFRLITKAGEKGIINLTKAVPILGGMVGGTVDGLACAGVGKTAKGIFAREN
ncbi:hypothetical protein LBMAG42_55770 [Deltaproteobacteria bacterium]|nr:hypothetical protein LBMAG42_55770 [Deltaproteobacteria bacterium]